MNINVIKADTNVTRSSVDNHLYPYSYTKGFSINKKMEDSYITTAVVLYSMSDKS